MAADLASLAAICAERHVAGLVIGLPLNMDGSPGPMAGTVQGWARHLARGLDLAVYLQDERLSTETVREAILEQKIARPRPGAALDHHAAAVILEDALRRLATAA